MNRRALIALGVGQCVNWGVLYYAFAILLLPVQEELGVARWVVTGAFSIALLVSAASAPSIGRWSDRGHAGAAIQVGGFAAAALLALWALVPHVITLYCAWALLGLCMAGTLYEPAFVLIGRFHGDAVQRLRALAAITVFGGFASTIFLPLTAWLVLRLGWRGAVWMLAALVALSTYATRLLTLNTADPVTSDAATRDDQTAAPTTGGRFMFMMAAFALGSLGSAALMSNLVPALGERSVSPTLAATLGGLLGLMQVPGRAVLMRGGVATAPSRLVALSLTLQAVGLIGLALSPSAASIALSIAVFAIGSGLTTLVRPHLVQSVFGAARSGLLNGRLARAQQLGRAAGPVLAASLAGMSSYATVFGVLGAVFVLTSIVWLSAEQRWSAA
jgi:MFS family permease